MNVFLPWKHFMCFKAIKGFLEFLIVINTRERTTMTNVNV